MRLDDHFSITVAQLSVREALCRAWADCPEHIDVVRVTDPDVAARRQLEAAGFVWKPSQVTWIAPTRVSEAEFIAQLSGKQRQNIRTARRRAAAEGLRTEVRQPLTAGAVDAFIRLYEQQVADMRNGLYVASRHRDMLLADPAYFAVLAFAGSELVGGCMCLECPAESAVRCRFSAARPQYRQSSLTRVIYLKAADAARRRGYQWITLGNDYNLYGHVGEPGLISFKSKLGFRPVPSHDVLPGDGYDEADLIVNLRNLSDPAVLLGYSGARSADGGWPVLRGEVFTGRPEIELHAYRTKFIADFRVHRLGVR